MVILAKKFLTKFTKIWNFIPNTVFGDRPLTTKFIQHFLLYLKYNIPAIILSRVCCRILF